MDSEKQLPTTTYFRHYQEYWLYYDVLVAGHGERWKMMELVISNYWWPEVTKNIGKYVDRYNLCQKMKNRTEVPAEKLIVNKIPEKV